MTNKQEKSQQPTNTPLSKTRRSALKKMLVGTSVAAGAVVLPDKWAKPVVNKILVPAHAQTSSEPTTSQAPQPQPTTEPTTTTTTTTTMCPAGLSCSLTGNECCDINISVTATTQCGHDFDGAIVVATVCAHEDAPHICTDPVTITLNSSGFGSGVSAFGGSPFVTVEFQNKAVFGPSTSSCGYQFEA